MGVDLFPEPDVPVKANLWGMSHIDGGVFDPVYSGLGERFHGNVEIR